MTYVQHPRASALQPQRLGHWLALGPETPIGNPYEPVGELALDSQLSELISMGWHVRRNIFNRFLPTGGGRVQNRGLGGNDNK